MFPTQRKSSIQHISAVFDIESGSVGASVICMYKDAPAEVLVSMRSQLSYEERDASATALGILTLLSEVGSKTLAEYALQKKYSEPIDSVYAIIRAPWTTSQMLTTTQVFDTDTVITEAMIANLAQKALPETPDSSKPVFETSVVRVELNGYPTSKPTGKTARSIALSLLVSDCDSRIHTGVSETLSKFFPSKTPIMRSGARAIISLLQEIRPNATDFVVADMASKGTQLVNVINGVAVSHETVEEGVYSILARISVNHLPDEALSTLRMMSRGQCTEDVSDAMNLAMSIAEPDMAKAFGEALSKLSSQARLPNKIFLFTQADIASWLEKFFMRIDFAQFTQTTQPFSVEAVTLDSLASQVTFDPNLSVDLGVMVGAALVHIEHSH